MRIALGHRGYGHRRGFDVRGRGGHHRHPRRRAPGGHALPAAHRRAVGGGDGSAALSEGRRHRVVPADLRTLRGGGVRRAPARPPRHRLVVGHRHRRVHRRRTFRPAHRDRVAGRAAVVERTGRHVRHLVLGVQRLADGGRRRTRIACGRGHLRHRRPLYRRRPLLRRRAAGDRPDRLPALHDRHERAAAGASGVRRGLARRVATAHRRHPAVAAGVARAPRRRRHVAPRIDPARPRRGRLRADVVPVHADRRLGRRVSQQLVPCGRAVRSQRAAVEVAGRTMGAQVARTRPARPERRRRRRRAGILRPAPPRRRRHTRRAGSGLCPPPGAPRAGSRVPSWPLGRPRHVAACRAAPRHVRCRSGRRRLAVDRGRRRVRRMELVRRRAAVGAAARPAHRQRAIAGLRLAGRRRGGVGRHAPRLDAGPCRPGLRPRQRQALRRVTRRVVGTDHPRHARPAPSRLLAGRSGGCGRRPAVGHDSGRVERHRHRAGGDDVDARARPRRAARRRRDRLAQLLAPARPGHARPRRRVDRARAATGRPARIAPPIPARLGPRARRGRGGRMADRTRRARPRDTRGDPLRRDLRRPARRSRQRRLPRRAGSVDGRSGASLGARPRELRDRVARRHRHAPSRRSRSRQIPTPSTSRSV